MTQTYNTNNADTGGRSFLGTLIIWILIALGATVVVNIFFGGWFGLISFAITAAFWMAIGYFLRGHVERKRSRR